MIAIAMQDFHRGGTERIAIGLAAAWRAVGEEVTIVCGSERGEFRNLVDPGVKVVPLNPPIHRSLASRVPLASALARKVGPLRPDTIFLPGNSHLFLAPALRSAAPKAVIVQKISNPPLPQSVPAAMARWAFGLFGNAVSGFAAMSPGLAAEMAGIMPGKPVRTLYDPVHVTPLPPQPRRGKYRILWAGRLESQKDPGLMLETFVAFARQHPAHLTILGDGSLRATVEKAISTMQAEEVIALKGHVDSIAAELADADVLLVTSRYEGGPAVAIEALACGVPVVSTDCSPLLRGVLTIPEAGRIVASRKPQALADALAAVLTAPRPPRETLAALTAPFEPAACAAAYLDFFTALGRP